MRKDRHRERWVECPVCNRKITRATVTCSDHICPCGVIFTACVTQDFIITIIHGEKDDLSMDERIKRFQEQLDQFAANN